jgi:hypothetical protein
MMSTAIAAEDTSAAKEEVNLLFVQTARGATLADGVLRLNDVSPATLFFSDRPDRVTGHEPTEDFVADWDIGDDSFKVNPPNATLSILVGDEPQEIVVELMSPRLDGDDLVYNVKVLDGKQQVSGGVTSIFIDTLGRPLTPVSVAGIHRRERRRTIRRVTPGPL